MPRSGRTDRRPFPASYLYLRLAPGDGRFKRVSHGRHVRHVAGPPRLHKGDHDRLLSVRKSEEAACTDQADVDVRRGLAERKVLLAVDGHGEHLQKERGVTRGIAMHRRSCSCERTEGSSWKMAAVPSPWWTSKSNTRTDVSPRCRTARRAATARSLMAVNPLREWAVRTSTSRTK